MVHIWDQLVVNEWVLCLPKYEMSALQDFPSNAELPCCMARVWKSRAANFKMLAGQRLKFRDPQWSHSASVLK